ncbi:flagellar basal-body rod protein FlgG [Fictibacillus phosphorivorans]|uniref:Flagellar hook protein FlgE n=1 Tax=Fictibacillus phosphorivorans TaxID=1221500 RepID=A0A163QWX8_9BACL|nr:flagellar basal body rod protein FlgG [Fictibacillus phosphorivorans]KZE65876.1 flagellar basal-body rod protein FlgG [Fictibacillus phosphorivorans]
MLRSMYSGISGMKNFQVKLDVIGNNIANVNTYGFKKGRTTFKDLVSQQIAGASAPTANAGGVNAKQVGLGSQLSTIDTIHTQGSLQTTGRPLDLGISGDGYFIVGTGTVSGKTITNPAMNFTRAGNFYLDQQGNLVNSDGLFVMGHPSDVPTGNPATNNITTTSFGKIVIPTDAKSFSVGSDGVVNYVDANGALLKAGQIMIAKFPNNEGLEKIGANLYKNSANSGDLNRDTTNAAFQPTDMYTPGSNGAGTLVAGALEMSNVDLSEEFTEMIVAQRGFQANTRIITTSDEILQELVNLKR